MGLKECNTEVQIYPLPTIVNRTKPSLNNQSLGSLPMCSSPLYAKKFTMKFSFGSRWRNIETRRLIVNFDRLQLLVRWCRSVWLRCRILLAVWQCACRWRSRRLWWRWAINWKSTGVSFHCGQKCSFLLYEARTSSLREAHSHEKR